MSAYDYDCNSDDDVFTKWRNHDRVYNGLMNTLSTVNGNSIYYVNRVTTVEFIR